MKKKITIGIGILVFGCCTLYTVYAAWATRPAQTIRSEDVNSFVDLTGFKVTPESIEYIYYPINSSRVPGPTDYVGYAKLTFNKDESEEISQKIAGLESLEVCREEDGYHYNKSEYVYSFDDYIPTDQIQWYVDEMNSAMEEGECTKDYYLDESLISPRFFASIMEVDGVYFISFGNK